MPLFHLIAPSGYYIKQHATLRGIQRLTDAGHRINNVEVIVRCCERLVGTETERLEDLNSLARLITLNTIVLSVCGGYGASRLLVDIGWQVLAAHRQHDLLLICEHSNFTAIQCGLLVQGNVITFSGPIPIANLGVDELNAFTGHHFWLALRNRAFTTEQQGGGPTCQIEGTLWGGNSAMLISLISIPWIPKIENGTLVLEDINEYPFCVERMLLQLYYAGILSRQKATILSSSSDSTPNNYDTSYNLESVYVFSRSRLSIPPIIDLDFGHEQRTVTLSLGAHIILNNTQEGTQLTISGHPVLRI